MMQLSRTKYDEMFLLFSQATRNIKLPLFFGNRLVMGAWLLELNQRGLALYVLTCTLWLADEGGSEPTDWNSVSKISSAQQWASYIENSYDYEYPEFVSYFIGPKNLM